MAKKPKQQADMFPVERTYEKPPKRYDPFERVEAPFTEEQVILLNRYQFIDSVHPFTCFYNGDIKLVATEDGWICPVCGYSQNWCHAMMINKEWIDMVSVWNKKN